MGDEGGENTGQNIKITLIGGTGVGKTCIIKRYTEGSFDDNSPATTGGSYSNKIITIDNIDVNLDLWDTAGQEKYRSLGRHFYKNAYIVCLVYDITNHESFEELKEKWYKDLKMYGEKYTVIAVVGNKSDCYEKEKVSEEEAREYAKSIKAQFMLTSAKKGNNIDVLFETLTRQYLGPEFMNKVQEMKQDKGEIKKVTRKKAKEKPKKKKCC